MKKAFIAVLLLLPIMMNINGCGDSSHHDNDDGPVVHNETQVRVLHASPDAPALDIFIDAKKEWSNVPYKGPADSGYVDVDEGQRNFRIDESGTSDTLIPTTPLTLKEKTPYSLLVVGFEDDMDLRLIEENNTSPKSGHAKIRAVHASPNEDALDIYITEPGMPLDIASPTFEGIKFKEPSSFCQKAAGEYQIRVTPSGETDPIFDSGTVTLDAGSILTAVVVNATGGASPINLVVLANDQDNPVYEYSDVHALLRVMHTTPDAGVVEVLFNDKDIFPSVSPKQASVYQEVDAGEQNIKVNEYLGTTLIEETRNLISGKTYTLLTLDLVDYIELRLLEDGCTAPSEDKAKIRFIHASPDAPNLDMLIHYDDYDDKVLSDLAFKEVSDYLDVWAGKRNIDVNKTETNDKLKEVRNLELKAGEVYTFVVVGEIKDNSIKAVLLLDSKAN